VALSAGAGHHDPSAPILATNTPAPPTLVRVGAEGGGAGEDHQDPAVPILATNTSANPALARLLVPKVALPAK
jgi:hypothetical protein